jgi:hypothetical protein
LSKKISLGGGKLPQFYAKKFSIEGQEDFVDHFSVEF